MRLIEFIRKTLTTKVPPMVYILLTVNVIIGFCFATGIFVSFNQSVLYASGVLVDRNLWGALLAISSTIGLLGLIGNHKSHAMFSGMVGFLLWLFAVISLAINNSWYIMITIGMLHLLFHGYVYLASALGTLRRKDLG